MDSKIRPMRGAKARTHTMVLLTCSPLRGGGAVLSRWAANSVVSSFVQSDRPFRHTTAEGVQNSVSQPAASQADVFVQALGEVDGHL